MKRFSLLMMVMILSITLLGGCGQKDTATNNEVSATGNTIVIGTAGCYPPLEWIDKESNELVGFDIEIMDAICREVGLKTQYKVIAFDGLVPALQSKEIDLIDCGLTITEERKKAIAFSNPYLKSGDTFMYPKNKDIKGPEDLSGKFVGIQANSSTQFGLEKINKELKEAGKEPLKLKMFKTMQDAIAELKIGGVEAVAIDYPMAADYLTNHPNEPFKYNKPFASCDFGFGIRQDNQDLVEKVNEGLAKIKETGEYDKLMAKYFSE